MASAGTFTTSLQLRMVELELLQNFSMIMKKVYFAPEITNLSSGYGSGTFYNRHSLGTPKLEIW